MMTPATKPITREPHGATKAQGAVMPTRAAMAPLPPIPTSTFLRYTKLMSIAPRTPAAAARVVVRAMSAIWVLAAIVEPGLKPYQPIQRIRTPSTASGMLWPGMVTGRPSSSYLPRRGPSRRVPARAAMAPERWTTVEPAKSCIPSSVSQPPPQIQCPTNG